MTATAALDPFPTHLLKGSQSALIVFAAAFGGRQDAQHIRDAGMTAMCVDSDSEALERMRPNYPNDWLMIDTDAFEFLDKALNRGFLFDVVTMDPFTGLTMDKTIEHLPDFCSLATRLVVCGCDGREVQPPEGWRIKSKTWRSGRQGGIYWVVLVPV